MTVPPLPEAGPFARLGPGRFASHVGAKGREAIVAAVEVMRQLLTHESAASDPALGRLFPAAHPDDLFLNLEFERAHASSLLADQLADLDTVERTARSHELTEEELLAWLRSLNAVRLVLGTRLGITQDTTEGDYAGDVNAEATFDLFGYLGWLESCAIEALSAGLDAPA